MDKFIDAGRLNRRVTLQTRATNDAGDPQSDRWETFAVVWAEIANAGAKEYWAAQAAQGELTHKITIRYRPGVTADMRIRYGERTFATVAPPVDIGMARKYLVLKCREVTETMYTPHTVTVYNVREDPRTFVKTVSITLLPGVLLRGGDAAAAQTGRMAARSGATLSVPWNVAARDALSGEPCNFVSAKAYAAAEDTATLWTLDPNRDFFVLGEVVDESGSFQAIKASHDGVYRVTAVTVNDAREKATWHIEAEGA